MPRGLATAGSGAWSRALLERTERPLCRGRRSRHLCCQPPRVACCGLELRARLRDFDSDRQTALDPPCASHSSWTRRTTALPSSRKRAGSSLSFDSMRLCAARRASLDGAPPGQAAGQHSARRRAPCRVPAAAPHIALRARAALPVHTTRCTAREFFSRAVHCACAFPTSGQLLSAWRSAGF